MSRRTALCIMGLVAGLAHPGIAGAQDLQTYEHRVDTLVHTLRRATALRTARDTTTARQREALDSLAVGPARFIVSPWARTYASQAASLALDALTPQFGQSLEGLKRVTYMVREEVVHDVGNRDTTYVRVAEIAPDGKESFSQVVAPRVDLVASTMRTAMLGSLTRASDQALSSWLAAALPADTADQAEWPRARVELLSSPAVVARRCYSGSVRDCRLAFGLAETSDP